jgi:hypothetical protein
LKVNATTDLQQLRQAQEILRAALVGAPEIGPLTAVEAKSAVTIVELANARVSELQLSQAARTQLALRLLAEAPPDRLARALAQAADRGLLNQSFSILAGDPELEWLLRLANPRGRAPAGFGTPTPRGAEAPAQPPATDPPPATALDRRVALATLAREVARRLAAMQTGSTAGGRQSLVRPSSLAEQTVARLIYFPQTPPQQPGPRAANATQPPVPPDSRGSNQPPATLLPLPTARLQSPILPLPTPFSTPPGAPGTSSAPFPPSIQSNPAGAPANPAAPPRIATLPDGRVVVVPPSPTSLPPNAPLPTSPPATLPASGSASGSASPSAEQLASTQPGQSNRSPALTSDQRALLQQLARELAPIVTPAGREAYQRLLRWTAPNEAAAARPNSANTIPQWLRPAQTPPSPTIPSPWLIAIAETAPEKLVLPQPTTRPFVPGAPAAPPAVPLNAIPARPAFIPTLVPPNPVARGPVAIQPPFPFRTPAPLPETIRLAIEVSPRPGLKAAVAQLARHGLTIELEILPRLPNQPARGIVTVAPQPDADPAPAPPSKLDRKPAASQPNRLADNAADQPAARNAASERPDSRPESRPANAAAAPSAPADDPALVRPTGREAAFLPRTHDRADQSAAAPLPNDAQRDGPRDAFVQRFDFVHPGIAAATARTDRAASSDILDGVDRDRADPDADAPTDEPIPRDRALELRVKPGLPARLADMKAWALAAQLAAIDVMVLDPAFAPAEEIGHARLPAPETAPAG